jgi:hypothetical protein
MLSTLSFNLKLNFLFNVQMYNNFRYDNQKIIFKTDKKFKLIIFSNNLFRLELHLYLIEKQEYKKIMNSKSKK